METDENRENKKQAVEDAVNLQIPTQIQDFAEFYAQICGTDRETLLTNIVIDQLTKIKEQCKTLPYMKIPEVW